jgi:hypothetical protein
MPRLRHLSRGERARADESERRDHDPTQPEALHQRSGERSGEAEQDEVDRDRCADRRPTPAEVVAQRIDQHAGRRAEPSGAEQREERHHEHHPRVVRPTPPSSRHGGPPYESSTIAC